MIVTFMTYVRTGVLESISVQYLNSPRVCILDDGHETGAYRYVDSARLCNKPVEQMYALSSISSLCFYDR